MQNSQASPMTEFILDYLADAIKGSRGPFRIVNNTELLISAMVTSAGIIPAESLEKFYYELCAQKIYKGSSDYQDFRRFLNRHGALKPSSKKK